MSVPATAVRASILDRVLRDYASVAAQLPGDAAAHARAAARLTELGWPSVRDEQWRYANLRAFERLSGFQPAAAGALDTELPAAIAGFERLIFVDGVQVTGRHRLQDDTAVEHSGATHVWPADQRLGLLCDMFARDAARLSVRGEAAIELVFVNSGRAAAAAVYPRLQLHLQPGSHLRLIERHLGQAAAPALVACNLRVELGRAAVLTHYRLQQYGQDTLFADTLWAHLAEQARYTVRSVAVGAGTARTSALVQLTGRVPPGSPGRQ